MNVHFLHFRSGFSPSSPFDFLQKESSGLGQNVGGLGEPMGRSRVIFIFCIKGDMIEDCCRDHPTAYGEGFQRERAIGPQEKILNLNTWMSDVLQLHPWHATFQFYGGKCHK